MSWRKACHATLHFATLDQGVGLAGRDRQRGFRSANQTPSPLRVFGIRGRTSPTVHHAIDIGRPPGDP